GVQTCALPISPPPRRGRPRSPRPSPATRPPSPRSPPTPPAPACCTGRPGTPIRRAVSWCAPRRTCLPPTSTGGPSDRERRERRRRRRKDLPHPGAAGGPGRLPARLLRQRRGRSAGLRRLRPGRRQVRAQRGPRRLRLRRRPVRLRGLQEHLPQQFLRRRLVVLQRGRRPPERLGVPRRRPGLGQMT